MKDNGTTNSCPNCNAAAVRVKELETALNTICAEEIVWLLDPDTADPRGYRHPLSEYVEYGTGDPDHTYPTHAPELAAYLRAKALKEAK